jgi:hypothetical protein
LESPERDIEEAKHTPYRSAESSLENPRVKLAGQQQISLEIEQHNVFV